MDIQAVLLRREQIRRDIEFLRNTASFSSVATTAKVIKAVWFVRSIFQKALPQSGSVFRMLLTAAGTRLLFKALPFRLSRLFFK